MEDCFYERLERVVKNRQKRDPTKFPEVRSLARSLRVKQEDMVEAAYDSEKLDLLVGFGISGCGQAEYEFVGDYQVEYYE